MKNNTKKLIIAALMAALSCIATIIIKVPIPATGGYINLGDGIVILSGFLLGPLYGGAAAGIGSALADVFSGYAIYAPATFIIKALMAVTVGFIFKRPASFSIVRTVIAGVICEIIMIGGYLVFETFIMSYGAGALAAVPGNIIQGICGIAVSTVLIPAVSKISKKTTLNSEHTN